MPKVGSFLELGTGAGNILLEALIQKKCDSGTGSDINPIAIENAV